MEYVAQRFPEDQDFSDMAFLGNMYFEKRKKIKIQKSLIPYLNGIIANDYENQKKINDIQLGGDAKFAIDNSLTLDLTINPDFSQVEVDDQITNLTRFEISLPEKRQFFLLRIVICFRVLVTEETQIRFFLGGLELLKTVTGTTFKIKLLQA